MYKDIQLFGDRLYAIFDPIQESKIGSIYVPDKHSERSRTATVMAVGPDVENYAVGDHVLISTYTGVRVHLVGQELFGQKVHEDTHRVLREEEILCKFLEG